MEHLAAFGETKPLRPMSKSACSSLGSLTQGGAVIEGDKVNGKPLKDWTVKRSLYQALHMAMAEEMERDPAVCVIGEDVGHYGGSYKATKDLHFRYGNFRCLDTPICENTFLGMGIGAAMHGLRPIVEGMNMGFLLLGFNQISNNAGMVRATSGGQFDVPMVIRGPGGVGKQLGPEHSQRIEAYLLAVPGLKLVACSTPRNARGLLKAAIRENNPVVFFEHVLTYGITDDIPLLPYTQPLDKAEVPLEGGDITILCYSKLRHVALDAAKQLKELGVHPEVVDLISLKPLDMATIKASVRKTKKCLILDESSRTGGIGAEIFTQVVENCSEDLALPPVRLATKDIPTPYARDLEEATIITKEDVVNAALWMHSAPKN
ncbi:pyruvate dehydrogenase E1 component subunit beta [Cyclospora cayetanensis]|uniref:Pyruvate dehydrogenase E1 component subunit beta n=1 Tax=Cyclospora cayetanensis TaxID=88456 RepID=A0A6P6RU45_9EIME|nr:pyruvate dehydrogenase E1 component subunit beta [Cyclospora cayetanensis]